MPKGMVVKPSKVRDKDGKRVLPYKVGDFTQKEYDRLLKNGSIQSAEPAKPAKQKTVSSGAGEDQHKADAKNTSDGAGDASSSGSGKTL